jgi:hypothetical protein
MFFVADVEIIFKDDRYYVIVPERIKKGIAPTYFCENQPKAYLNQ